MTTPIIWCRHALSVPHSNIQPNKILAETVPIAGDSGVPEWIQLTPQGARFEGRDGRRFRISSAKKLVAEFNALGEHLQLDLDHASEFGLGSASVGWLVEMAVREREIWGRVESPPQGQ